MSPPPVMTTGWPPWPQHPLTRSPTWQGSPDSHNNLTWLNWVLSYTHIWDAPGFWTFTFFCQTSLAHPAWIGHKLGKGAARRLMPSLHCSDEGLKMCCIWKPKSWIFTRPSLFSKLDVRPFKGYTIDNLILLFILHSFQTYQLLLGAKYCAPHKTHSTRLCCPLGNAHCPISVLASRKTPQYVFWRVSRNPPMYTPGNPCQQACLQKSCLAKG